jgi:hypothetical protein
VNRSIKCFFFNSDCVMKKDKSFFAYFKLTWCMMHLATRILASNSQSQIKLKLTHVQDSLIIFFLNFSFCFVFINHIYSIAYLVNINVTRFSWRSKNLDHMESDQTETQIVNSISLMFKFDLIRFGSNFYRYQLIFRHMASFVLFDLFVSAPSQ